MTIRVRVPHGLTWAVSWEPVVEAAGATLGELWANLHTAHPELMWRLSLEQGPPSFWVRIRVDGTPLGHPPPLDLALADGAEVALVVLLAGPAGNR